MPALPAIPPAPPQKERHSRKGPPGNRDHEGGGPENVAGLTFRTDIDAAFIQGVVSLAKQQPRRPQFAFHNLQPNAAHRPRQMPRRTGDVAVGHMSQNSILLEHRPPHFRFGKVVVSLDSHQSGDGAELLDCSFSAGGSSAAPSSPPEGVGSEAQTEVSTRLPGSVDSDGCSATPSACASGPSVGALAGPPLDTPTRAGRSSRSCSK